MSLVSPFGRLLKQWRQQRGVSQLALATRAELSQRHVSFLETGRARPGEETVHRLADALEVPLRERNSLLEGAGLPPLYPELPLDAEALAPFRAAIARILETHEPYPAFVVNRWWDVVDGNRAARTFLPLDDGPVSFIELFFAPGPFRELVVNYAEVAWATLRRLRAEAAQTWADERLQRLVATAERHLADVSERRPSTAELVICPHLRFGDQIIKTLSVVARFGNTRELTVDELRLELMLPQDAAADAFFRGLAASS